MSKALESMAKLVRIRERIALARARRIAAEFSKSKDLNEQVLGFAREYGDGVMQAGQTGISVSALCDTMAFRQKLLDGAKQQEMISQNLGDQMRRANLEAAAAKMKNKGFERLIARKNREHQERRQKEEWRAVEDDPRFTRKKAD